MFDTRELKYSNILINSAFIIICLTTLSKGINESSGKLKSTESNSNNNRYITKINGGVNAKANQASWNVAIFGGIHFTNGAIISPDYILTNGVLCRYS